MTPASALKLKKKAAEFESKKLIDKALSLYIQLLDESGKDLDDADLQLYNRVGDLLTRQGNVAEALTWYEKAVDVYAERGFLNNAIALCNKILRQSPSRSAVYYKLGKISASKGFKSDAKKNFLEYADRMQKAGKIDEAFRSLKEFADLCPDQDDIRLMLADWLAKENRKGEAVEQLETLYSKLEAEGRSAEARATIDRIKAIDPDVVPRASGSWTSQKSSDLIFLDLVEDAPQPRHHVLEPEREPTPARAHSPSLVPIVPALEGLTLTFHPDVDDAERASAAALDQLLQAAEVDPGAERSLAALGLQQEPGVASASPLDDDVARVSDDFVAIDLDAMLAQPPRLPTASLDANLPLLTPEGNEAFDTPSIDLLGVVGTPIGTPVILARAATLGGLDLLDLGENGSLGASLDAPALAEARESLPNVEHDERGVPSGDHPAVRADRDTSELVAIDDSARLTDELLAVEVEPHDEDDAQDGGARVPPTPTLDGDTTPDAWVDAALGARDDRSFDRFLTPLDAGAVIAPAIVVAADTRDAPAIAVPEHVPFSDIEAAKAEAADFDEYGPAKGPKGAPEVIVSLGDAEQVPSTEPDIEEGLARDALATVDPGTGDEGQELVAGPSEPQRPDWHGETPVPSSLEAFFGAPHVGEVEIDLLDELTPPFMRDPSAEHTDAPAAERAGEGEGEGVVVAEGFTSGEVRSAIDDALPLGDRERRADPDRSDLSGDNWRIGGDDPDAADAEIVTRGVDFGASALDTTALHASIEADGRKIEAAFRDDPIDLPMLDIGEAQASDDDGVYPAYDPTQRPTPEVESAGEALAAWIPTEEWSPDEAPEVLIDGEWRDENVGDLMTGEGAAVVDPSLHPPRPSSPERFDDLAAAMLWPADTSGGVDAREEAVHAGAGDGAPAGEVAPRSGVSFGGVEAQLRRRLEREPANWALRRQLGEELLGIGERDAGLAELESAMVGFEQLGDLEEARKVADSVLRAVPASVRHHQKRVEYAVRSSDRPRLVEAYVELADALFRSGDAAKAHVVYTRVLELSPSNKRARVALGLINADEAGLARVDGDADATERRFAAGATAALFSPATSPPSSLTASLTSSLTSSLTASPLPSSPAASLASTGNRSAIPGPSSPSPRPEESSPRPHDPARGERLSRESLPPADHLSVNRGGAGTAGAGSAGEEFIDLGDWLRAAEPVRSTRMITTDVAPTGDEQADFDDMLRRFKQGVAENVDEEDFASHYDLGVAFKEMGLTDEAISEFQKSLRGDEHRVRSYEALGQCFVEKGQMQVAVTLLRRAVESTGADDQQLVGVLFLLGFANEAMERHRDALGYYQRVFAVDIEFRDVAKRVAAMEHRTQ